MQKLNVVPRGVRCNLTHWFFVQMISSLIVLQLFRHAVQKYTSGSKKLEAKMTPPHNFSQQSDSESQCYKVYKPHIFLCLYLWIDSLVWREVMCVVLCSHTHIPLSHHCDMRTAAVEGWDLEAQLSLKY